MLCLFFASPAFSTLKCGLLVGSSVEQIELDTWSNPQELIQGDMVAFSFRKSDGTIQHVTGEYLTRFGACHLFKDHITNAEVEFRTNTGGRFVSFYRLAPLNPLRLNKTFYHLSPSFSLLHLPLIPSNAPDLDPSGIEAILINEILFAAPRPGSDGTPMVGAVAEVTKDDVKIIDLFSQSIQSIRLGRRHDPHYHFYLLSRPTLP